MGMFDDINTNGPSMNSNPMENFIPKEEFSKAPIVEFKKETSAIFIGDPKEIKIEESKQVIVPPKKNSLMEMELQDGNIVISTMDQKVAMINAAIKGGMLPKRFTDVGSVLAAQQYSKEIGLGGTLVSLKQIAVVEGTPTLFGDAPLALCLNSGKLESIKEYYLDKEQKVISMENKNMFCSPEMAVCEVKRIGDIEPIITYFSLNDAAKAGLIGRGVWSKYPKLMMKYRARAEALKGKFADRLNGVGIGEYDFHGTNEKECISNDKKESNLNHIVFTE